jgi:membrane-bound ClpP family serine protease
MKVKNRVRRIADIMEKLGVASLAIGLFQDNRIGVTLGVVCLLLALALTRED